MSKDDDVSTGISSLTKCSIADKNQIITNNQNQEKNLIEKSILPIIGNNVSSKSPSLLSKSTNFTYTTEKMRFRKFHPQSKNIFVKSPKSEIERPSGNINSHKRLPTLNTRLNNNNQKRTYEFQRKQIYSLNRLMCQLEQEKFREFCKLNGINTINSEEIFPNNEDLNNQL